MMDVRKAIKSYFDRSEFFQLVCTDDTAGGVSPREKYSSEIASSDAIIMILNTRYRKAVRDEYELSQHFKKRLFVFVKAGKHEKKQREFINIISEPISYTKYYHIDDLITSIEETLFTTMLQTYKEALSQNNKRDGLNDNRLQDYTGHMQTYSV